MSRYIQSSVLSAVSHNCGRSWNVLPTDTAVHLYFLYPFISAPFLYTVSEKDCTLFLFYFFLGAQCVASDVSCTDCY